MGENSQTMNGSIASLIKPDSIWHGHTTGRHDSGRVSRLIIIFHAVTSDGSECQRTKSPFKKQNKNKNHREINYLTSDKQ